MVFLKLSNKQDINPSLGQLFAGNPLLIILICISNISRKTALFTVTLNPYYYSNNCAAWRPQRLVIYVIITVM